MKLDKILNENIIKPYTVIADTYQKKHFNQKEFVKPIEDFLKLINTGKKILDAGCGPGGESKVMVERNFEVTGIDITKKMIELAKHNVPQANFQVMDVRKLQFPDNYFDGIWSARTLIHIPKDEVGDTLLEWKRVLKVGGIFGICVLKGDKELIEPEYYDSSGETNTFFHYFIEDELASILKEVDCNLVKQFEVLVGDDKESHLFAFAMK